MASSVTNNGGELEQEPEFGGLEVEETDDSYEAEEETEDEEDSEGEDGDEDYLPPVPVELEVPDPAAALTIREEEVARMHREAARQQIEFALRHGGQARGPRGPARSENAEEVADTVEVEDEEGDGLEVLEVPLSGGGGGGDRVEGGESSGSGVASGSQTDVSPASCPICLERWSQEGAHRVCCIPCGHVYGRSCLERWLLEQCGKNLAKCPQCNRKFRKREIINLYAPQIVVVNDNLEKEVSVLRAKNQSLSSERKRLLEQVRKYEKHEMDAENFARQKKTCLHQVSSGAMQMMSPDYYNWRQIPWPQISLEPGFVPQTSGRSVHLPCTFVLQSELDVDGARVLDLDVSSEILVISGKGSGWKGEHVLTKISLLVPCEMGNIQLPASTGAIRDLHISPSNTILPGRLALLASLGKNLSVFSMESNNVVLKYDLPGPSWSCSWDFNTPYHVYAGLQNGMLLVFDLRQTARPLELIHGVSGHPVHTIHSLVQNDERSARTILTASSMGPCLWDVSSSGNRPFLFPEMENQGVCISLACASSSDNIVASFHPKVEVSIDSVGSQPSQSQSPSPTVTGPVKLGTHVLLKRVVGNTFQKAGVTSGNVSEVRMSKSAVIPLEGCNPLFAYGDEAFHGMCIWDLPSFQVVRRLKAHQHPILDVKYGCSTGPGLLSCISENRLQVFTCSGL